MFRLSSEDGLRLLELARNAITSAVIDNRLPDIPCFGPRLSDHRGTFVTLHHSGKLRGCVGQVENPGTLADGVIRAAISAALHDPRFNPVTPEEVSALDIEVSVLSPLEKLAPHEIVDGLHGVFVVRPPHKALLLPQVAIERGWRSQRLLEETCIKAGLDKDAWKDAKTQIFAFTTESFLESEIRTIPGR